MTEVEAQEIVSEIVNAFAMEFARLGADQNRATQAQYRRYLLDLPAAATRAAVERMLATARFVPKIAEIREAVKALELGPVPHGRRGVGRRPARSSAPAPTGRRRSPIRWSGASCALGWRDLCLSENTVADRARFHRGVRSRSPRPSAGTRRWPTAGEPPARAGAAGGDRGTDAPVLPPAEPYDERDEDPFDSTRWNRKAVRS